MNSNNYRKRWRTVTANIANFLSHNEELPKPVEGMLDCDSVNIDAGNIDSENIQEFLPLIDEFDCQDVVYDYNCSDDGSEAGPPNAGSDVDDLSSSIANDLADWAVKNRISHTALNALLRILHADHKDLPLDARTLLQTPRKVMIFERCGGQFVYFGIEAGIVRSLARFNRPLSVNKIQLSIGVDGVQLFKSSNTNFWPVLCQYANAPPFLVALFCGRDKPNSVDDYMKEFIEEMQLLSVSGVSFSGVQYSVCIVSFICDAPARAFLKCTKLHNAYNACERCTTRGTWDGRVIFDELNAPLRTDENFANSMYLDHQIGVSPLASLAVPIVTSFVLDYMHLVCLGVVRRMIMFWKSGPKKIRLGFRLLDDISTALVNCKSYIPREFARQPRSLKEVDRWKATEFRQFLLYTGPVVLKNRLPAHVYSHFMCLSVAMRILLSDSLCVQYCDYAKRLLVYFVDNCSVVYGRIMLVYNVHSLIHLADDVYKYKCSLDKLSAFPFENYMSTLKKYVRSPLNPIAQVSKRIQEYEAFAVQINRFKFDVNDSNHVFHSSKRDNCYALKSGQYIFVKEVRIVADQTTLVCDVCPLHAISDFFVDPCQSTWLKIVYVNELLSSMNQQIVLPQDIGHKCLCLPDNGGFVLMPLLHFV